MRSRLERRFEPDRVCLSAIVSKGGRRAPLELSCCRHVAMDLARIAYIPEVDISCIGGYALTAE